MKLTAHRIPGVVAPIRAAPPTRDWMDQSRDRFAYRCLPLNVANSHGWEILCPAAFEAHWSGGARQADITITPLEDGAPVPVSHFGGGVLTFHTGYLFCTPELYSLHVSGPANRAKDGIVPLTGIAETDWLPFPLTMNWMFTAGDVRVRFEKDEPFCNVFPVRRSLLEEIEPELRELADNPELQQAYQEWNTSRSGFIQELPVHGSEAREQGWQKNYMRGHHPGGGSGGAEHRTRLRVREFEEK